MRVRGERECQNCGTRWSYYETGSVACPACASMRSVGVDERTTHTDSPAELDLAPHREAFGDARGTVPREGVDELEADLREYVRRRGFVRGGELLPLDDTYLAARELLEAVDVYDRLLEPTDADAEYLLALLAGADAGDRPATDEVPEPMREARGMAAARGVDEYREDLLTFLDAADANPDERADAVRERLERLRDRTKRVEALHGDVAPTVADALVDAANAIGTYLREGDADALARADDRLDDADF